MKCKYVFMSFYLSLLAIIGIAVYCTCTNVNPDTGFFIKNNVGYFFVIAIVAFAIIFSVASFSVRRCPLKNPSVNSVMSIACVPLIITLVGNLLVRFLINSTIPTDTLSLVVSLTEIAFIVFLTVYLFKSVLFYKINKIFYIVPLLFWLLKLILSYIEISTMGLTFENSFYILACAFNVLFFLYFLKYKSRIYTNCSHKLFLLISFFSTVCCEAYAVPQLINIFVLKQGTQHNSKLNYLLFVFTGVFVVVFIRSFFSMRNLKRKRDDSSLIMQ